MLGSANRDERQFEHPDDLDITREPNRHLAFGQGVHYCMGAPLARIDGQIAIDTLLRRFPDLKLAVPSHTLRRRRGLGLRGLASLPVSLSRRASLDLKPVSLHPGSKVRSSSVRPAPAVSRCPLARLPEYPTIPATDHGEFDYAVARPASWPRVFKPKPATFSTRGPACPGRPNGNRKFRFLKKME